MRTRILPAGLFLFSLAVGGGLTALIHGIEIRAETARFARLADLVAGRMQARIDQHVALLVATTRLAEADRLSAPDNRFADYIARLDLPNAYPGVQGIGFAAVFPAGDAAARQAALARIAAMQAEPAALTPAASDQPWRSAIVSLEPRDDRNLSAIGYDMYSQPIRRRAMQQAAGTGEPRASGPVSLVQEITSDKQAGFLIYMALRKPELTGPPGGMDDVAGFFYAPFRAGDLHDAILTGPGRLPVHIATVDRDAPGVMLYESRDPPRDGAQTARRDVDVVGRVWKMTISETAVPDTPPHLASLLVGVLSVLLSGALGALLRSHNMAMIEAENRARLAQRTAEERSLLLREMAHRIKNHLARIQAIGRQTQRESQDLADFGKRFGARLQAMAAAQDMLTLDGAASLRAMALRELGQIMSPAQAEAAIDGPEIELAPRQAQAMALVLHELATNAMKYGDDATPGRLSFHWRIEPRDGGWLQAEWFEPGACLPAETGRRGFGTELLEAMVEGDLEGRLTRGFADDGMHVQIGFPMARASRTAARAKGGAPG